MTDETEPQLTEENDKQKRRETDAELMRKLLGDQDARKKSEKDDWVQRRDAEEQTRNTENQSKETENDA